MRLFLGLFCIGHDLIFLRTSHSVPYYSSLNLRSIYRPLVSVSQTGRTQTCSDAFSTSEKYVYKYLNIFMSQTGFGQAAESQHQQRSIERERETKSSPPKTLVEVFICFSLCGFSLLHHHPNPILWKLHII